MNVLLTTLIIAFGTVLELVDISLALLAQVEQLGAI